MRSWNSSFSQIFTKMSQTFCRQESKQYTVEMSSISFATVDYSCQAMPSSLESGKKLLCLKRHWQQWLWRRPFWLPLNSLKFSLITACVHSGFGKQKRALYICYWFTLFYVNFRSFTCKLMISAVQKVFYLRRCSLTFFPTYKLFTNCTEISYYLNWRQGWKSGMFFFLA